jgi:hypothetical protein
MRTIKLITTFSLVLSAFTLSAQKKVALHSNGTASFFMGATPYNDAYTAAIDGDTIYLPGGTFGSPASIDKRIVVFGIGHHPDTSAVMGETIITGSMSLSPTAAKSHFEGLKFNNGNITYTGISDSIVIKRCYLKSINFNNFASVGTQVIENVVEGTISGTGSVKTIIANNIIKKASSSVIVNFANQAWIRNNIIVGTGTYSNYSHTFLFYEITNCLFENNIILNEGNSINNFITTTVTNNTFKNNVFNGNPELSLNTWDNNYFTIASNTIFNNYTGVAFNYAEDFQLVSPTSYVGTTGNEVGLYGGYTPAKVGFIPVNPHFQYKDIAPATDVNGDLHIQIKVGAQDH